MKHFFYFVFILINLCISKAYTQEFSSNNTVLINYFKEIDKNSEFTLLKDSFHSIYDIDIMNHKSKDIILNLV